MLTRQDIINYHAKKDIPSRYHGAGVELELFVVDRHGQIIPYHNTRGPSIEKVFDYLVTRHGWKK
mgnify:CR=1 FL=1